MANTALPVFLPNIWCIHIWIYKGRRYLLKTWFPNIEHEFDVWHVSKSLMKKIKALDKKHPEIQAWKASINNNLSWSAQT
ncbi:hypothetical protein PR048_017353, partial [Dryococelus australis]